MSTVYDRARPRSQTALRAEYLLSRYPNLSEQELTELINLFPHVNMVARGLMAADDHMGSKVEAFHRDHGAKLDSFGGPRATLIAATARAAMIIAMIVA